MTGKNNISVIMVTFNEESRIRGCLDSVKWADEIIVVDQSSSDRTAKICSEYTGKVYVVPNKGYCEPDRPLAMSKASNDWVLYLDADEIVTDDLRIEIEALLSGSPRYCGYYVARKNIYIGKWIKYSGWYPSRVLRLFRKESVTFSEEIHTDVIPKGECGRLLNDLEHYTYRSVDEHVNKMIRYTDVTARRSYAKGDRITAGNFFGKLIILPVIYFLHRYIWLGGFKDGMRGLLIGIFTFTGVFLANAKLWQLQGKCTAQASKRPMTRLAAAADIVRTFLFLVVWKRIDRIYSDTGYSDLAALFMLARDGAGDGVIAEIGAFKGKSAVVMALGSVSGKREKVYSIDPHIEKTKETFRENVRNFSLDDRVVMIEATSEEARVSFSSPIRLLFIDGCHEYNYVKQDILIWKDLITDGGVIVFHDINWPTVSRAVDELVAGSGEFVVEARTGCSLIVSKGYSANTKIIEKIKLFNRMKDIILLRKTPPVSAK